MSDDTTVETDNSPSLDDRLQELVGTTFGAAQVARDPVNQAMIRHWCDAMGDANPVYTDPEAAADSVHGGIVAPPTMLQAWTMPGLVPRAADADGSSGLAPYDMLDEAGFTSVVATNCDQEYTRYPRPGDHLRVNTVVDSISSEKTTGLGTGHFVTTLMSYTTEEGELVGTMKFRVLKFRPPEKAGTSPTTDEPPPARRPRPLHNRDTQHYWEGVQQGELRIQRCTSCGELRHPPRPGCPNCQSLEWDTIVAGGSGEVHSFVVHHYPPVPGLEMPFAVVLVELAEGVRLIGNVVGVEPDDVEIGMKVEVEFVEVDDEQTLPMWRLAGDH